jgi:hypothetical protein
MKRLGFVLSVIVMIVGTLTRAVGAPPSPPPGKTGATVIWTGKAGFLMQDQGRLAGGEYNDFTMRFTKGKESPDRYT